MVGGIDLVDLGEFHKWRPPISDLRPLAKDILRELLETFCYLLGTNNEFFFSF